MSVALEEVNGWLDDLWCLATGVLDGGGAKDTINSIENALPFYVEDQLAGLASQLLSPASDRSLPAILRRSLQDQSANHQIQRELRAEILRFFEVCKIRDKYTNCSSAHTQPHHPLAFPPINRPPPTL